MIEIDRYGYSPEEFELQYNPRAAVPDHQIKIDLRNARSADVRKRLKGTLDIRYGPNPNELLDIYPSKSTNVPVQLYVHGGYWRSQDKADVAYLAEPLTSAGAIAVIINYDLCPSVGLDEVVAEVRRVGDDTRASSRRSSIPREPCRRRQARA